MINIIEIDRFLFPDSSNTFAKISRTCFKIVNDHDITES